MSQLRNEFILNADRVAERDASVDANEHQLNRNGQQMKENEYQWNVNDHQRDRNDSTPPYGSSQPFGSLGQSYASQERTNGYEVISGDYSAQMNQSQNALLHPNRWDKGTSHQQTPPLGELTELREQHELSQLRGYSSNPFIESRQIENPFEHEQSRYTQNDLGYPQNSSGYPQSNSGVFLDNDPMFSDEISDKDSIERRLKHNETNRQKLATRLPRFHVTKLPYFSIIVSSAQTVVFIVELARMGILTGSPFQTQPYFNPMLGPSTYLLVNMGARYVPCMHPIANVTLDMSLQFPCPNSTTIDTNVCNLSELCGMGGIPIVNNTFVPDQRIRVFTPIFLHAGFLHILFNMMLQLAMGLAIERHIGFIKYGLIYMSSGVAGFLLGANFAPNGVASTGASGSLFGVIATNLLLFIYCGRKNTNIYFTKKYALFIFVMVAEIIVSFVLGLLPGLDNFSHIGGFCVGLLVSIALLKDPSFVYLDGIYTYDANMTTWELFIENWNPLNRIEDKVRWKVGIWVVLRVICLALVIVYFVLLTKNLYSAEMQEDRIVCSWCKFINCIPVNNWCDLGEVTVTTVPSTSLPTSNAFTTTSNIVAATATPTQILNNRAKISMPKVDLAGTTGTTGTTGTYIHALSSHVEGILKLMHEETIVFAVVMAILSVSTILKFRSYKKK